MSRSYLEVIAWQLILMGLLSFDITGVGWNQARNLAYDIGKAVIRKASINE